MTTLDCITLGLSIWGALLSSTLGIVKLREYKRSLKIYLEWQAFFEKCHLVITNYGKRPLTVKRIVVRSPEDGWTGFAILDEGQNEKLPKKLTYGDEVTYVLNDEIAWRVWSEELRIYIHDSEENEYTPTMKRDYSPRYDGYSKFVKIKYGNK